MNAFDAVDNFLLVRHRLGLEEVLCDGCLLGRVSIALDGVAQIAPRLVHSTAEEDGGANFTYQGVLTLNDIRYHFRCHIFVDAGGQHFLSDVPEFEPVDWKACVKVPGQVRSA